MMNGLLKSALICVICGSLSSPGSATEPNVRNVSVRGFQVGGTTTLTIDGDDLGPAPKLLLPLPAKQTLKPGATDKQATFEVALDADVPPGFHHLRVVTAGGVSLPVLVGVDALPQRPVGPDAGSLPVALHGSVGGSAVVETTFTGKAGQKLMVEVEAQRLGGKLRPVLHLYGPNKLQLAWAWGEARLLGDARLEATLPEDGAYTVTLHDAEYAAPAPGHFRLKLGQWRSVEQVFPPVAANDTKAVELLGPAEPVRIDLPAGRNPFHPLAWPKGQTWSGPRPWVEPSSRPEFVAPLAGAQLPVPPFAVSGRFPAAGDAEPIRTPVVAGTKVRFEVFAERLGSPVDAALVVRNESGAELARGEDGPGTLDPVLEFAVPEKVGVVLVSVTSQSGRGHGGSVYRVTVDPVPATRPTDFRLFTTTQRLTLPVGGRAVVPVYADRRGTAGKIELTAAGLPDGVKLDGAVIPADADGALMAVTWAESAGEPAVAELRGRAAGGVERPVFVRGHPLERLQPWLAAELAVAPTTAKATDFAVEWRSLPQAAFLAPTGRYSLPVTVTRADPAVPVRLTLLTSQAPVVANNQPDPARSIRAEKPVELAAKASTADLTVLLPVDLPADAYDLAVQADLLSADKQRVLAAAFTPVRRLPVRLPIAVKLSSPAKVTLTIDPKSPPTAEIKGTVERLGGATGDVTVTLGGLPPGVQTTPVTVKSADTAFTVPIRVLPTTAPGTTKGLPLSATIAPDPKQPTVRVKSRDVELELVILPPK